MREGAPQKVKRAAPLGSLRLFTQSLRPALRLLVNPATLVQLPRLLREGYAPVRRMFVQAHNGREIARLLEQGQQITFVSSFARSGNTWLRYLLSDVFLQNHGVETATELAVHPDLIVPDFYCEMIARRNSEVPTPGVLIKTHDLLDRLEQRFARPQANAVRGKCRHLYLFRTAEDALVSLYHFQLREKYVKNRVGFDIDAFCLDYVAEWISHVSSYLAAPENDTTVFFVSYDQLLQNPENILVEVLRWLGVAHTSGAVGRAVQNMRFGNLRALEARDSSDKPPVFRQGRNGSGSKELKAATVSEIRRQTEHLTAQADKRVGFQRGQRGQYPVSVTMAPPGNVVRNEKADGLETTPKIRSS